MRPVRAIVFGVFLWLLTFFLLSALTFVFGINYPTDMFFIVYFVFFILFTVMCVQGYFWVPKMRGGLGQGVFVGLVFLVLMAILHLIVIVPFIIESMNFMYRIDTLVSFLLVIIISIIVGVGKR